MFDRRSFFTAVGSGIAATALVATVAQAAPVAEGLSPAVAPAAADAQPVEMRGPRRRHHRRPRPRHHRRHRARR